MRYKLLLSAFVLLISTPVFAQEFSPIVIKTGKPTPSVVKTGEQFKVKYTAEFLDTVIIDEGQMQPENLAFEEVEAIGLNVTKERGYNDNLGVVNVWEFTYTFRIIQPEKGIKKIPPFNFFWFLKKAGVTEQETKDRETLQERETEEVGIGYVSSIVKPPPIDIRDETKFISPVSESYVLRRWAYGSLGILSLIIALVLYRFFRHPKVSQSQEASLESGAEIQDADSSIYAEPVLAINQARKKFLEELRNMRAKAQLPKLRILVRSLILNEFRGILRDSMTENEIYAKLSGFNDKQKREFKSKYNVMIDLARRLKDYQENIDSGNDSLGPEKQLVELRTAVEGLRRGRVQSFLRRFRRGE